MAAVTTLNNVSVSMKLNNGTSATGAVKTVSVSLGSLNKDTFEANKAMAIVTLLTPCLAKSLVSVNKTEYSTLTVGE